MTINSNFDKILKNINVNANSDAVKRSQSRLNSQQQAKFAEKGASEKSFAEILKEKTKDSITTNSAELRRHRLSGGNINSADSQKLIFSKHAQQRLFRRNIDIAPELAEKIEGAVKRASDKNIKNALILTHETAFIVNVDSSVVVTAMNNDEMRDNVITNIDGTVIL